MGRYAWPFPRATRSSTLAPSKLVYCTVSTNVSLVLTVPSLTVTVMVAVPDWPAAGVTVTVRLAPFPPNTMLFVGTKVRFEDALLRLRLFDDVSKSPIVKLIAPVDVPRATVRFAISDTVGGSFTAEIVSEKGSDAVSTPSLTVMVMVALPV